MVMKIIIVNLQNCPVKRITLNTFAGHKATRTGSVVVVVVMEEVSFPT